MKKRRLVIDRKVWLRGEGGPKSMLLRPYDGKMCCVGIYLEACGMSRTTLSGNQAAVLDAVVVSLPKECMWLVQGAAGARGNTLAAQDLYGTNDDPELDEPSRERRIKRRFARHDVQVVFE